MKMILSYLIFLVSIILVFSDDCFDIIKELSQRDSCLSSRFDVKKKMANKAIDYVDFISLVRNYTCKGNEFNAAATSSWVSEIFEGINTEYQELKNYDDFNGVGSGYNLYIGNDVYNLFKNFANNQGRLIYKLRHTGIAKHSWVIEQLPKKQGYRIYQSYADAFSLKSWLNHNITDIFNSYSGDIKNWTNLLKTIDNKIIELSNGYANLLNPEKLNATFKTLIPYFIYAREYKNITIYNNFVQAWELYGKGQIISWDLLNTYLLKLSGLTSYLYNLKQSNATYYQQMWDDWILLYGSPDIYHFPYAPNEDITNFLIPENKNYRFEISVTMLTENPPCLENDIYMNYLTTNSHIITISLPFYVLILFLHTL